MNNFSVPDGTKKLEGKHRAARTRYVKRNSLQSASPVSVGAGKAPYTLLPFFSQMQSGERFAFERTSSAVNELLRIKRRSE